MTTDDLLERLLDKVDGLSESAAELSTDMKFVKDHLAKLNGSVARHQEALNEAQLWRATHEQNCKPKINDMTILKSVAMVCVTVLTALGASASGIAEALLTIFK